MADYTLCSSDDCPVRERCVRNAACPQAITSGTWQSSSYWQPQLGEQCEGFWPMADRLSMAAEA